MSKPGSGGIPSSQQSEINRKSRVYALTSDVSKDPYLTKNHLGTYECRLCLTIHTTEGSYLVHVNGKKHNENLTRRAAKLASQSQHEYNASTQTKDKTSEVQVKSHAKLRIGRCGYKIVKQYDRASHSDSILLQLTYPALSSSSISSSLLEEIGDVQPRHRFMSSYEQHIEKPDSTVQYLVIACVPYDTISFKIPNRPIQRESIITHWDTKTAMFTMQFSFQSHNESKI